MGHDHQTGDWKPAQANPRQLTSDARWHRAEAERIRTTIAAMTPEQQAAVGARYVEQQHRDRRLHLQLAEELEAYLAAEDVVHDHAQGSLFQAGAD